VRRRTSLGGILSIMLITRYLTLFQPLLIWKTDPKPWYLPPEKVGMVDRFLNRLTGVPNPSPEYRMEGYIYEEVGPPVFEGKGKDKVDKETAELVARGKVLLATKSSGGCPFATLN
jgi:hypothetical protein